MVEIFANQRNRSALRSDVFIDDTETAGVSDRSVGEIKAKLRSLGPKFRPEILEAEAMNRGEALFSFSG